MKKYLLFGGSQYYPLGGWGDFAGSFDTIDLAVIHAAGEGWDWWQVIDSETGDEAVTS